MIRKVLFCLVLLFIITISTTKSTLIKKQNSILIDSNNSVSCEDCYFFFKKELMIIYNLIFVDQHNTCYGVCSNLPNATTSFKESCFAFCEKEGYFGFRELIGRGDQPTLVCNLLNYCKDNIGSAAKINSVVITPDRAIVGSNFSIVIDFEVTSTIYSFQMQTFIIDHYTEFSNWLYFFNYEPGFYSNEVIFQTESNTKHLFWSGNYNVMVTIGSDQDATYAQNLTSLYIEPIENSSMNDTSKVFDSSSYF